jgi:hypothetical protein
MKSQSRMEDLLQGRRPRFLCARITVGVHSEYGFDGSRDHRKLNSWLDHNRRERQGGRAWRVCVRVALSTERDDAA